MRLLSGVLGTGYSLVFGAGGVGQRGVCWVKSDGRAVLG